MNVKLCSLLSFLILGLTATTALASDRGTINFCNRMPAAEPAFDAPVFGPDRTTRLGGSNYLAQLYVGLSATNLLPQGLPVPFASNLLAGYVFGGSVTATNFQPGSTVFVQLRAWYRLHGATYEAAQAAAGCYGASTTIKVQLGGDELVPPMLPADLVGLQSFALTNEVVGPPYLTALKDLHTGRFKLTCTNLSGQTWTTLASPDLAQTVTTWEVLGPLTPLGGDHYQFTDPAYSNAPQRFYRLRSP
jgi:hypothetical protein